MVSIWKEFSVSCCPIPWLANSSACYIGKRGPNLAVYKEFTLEITTLFYSWGQSSHGPITGERCYLPPNTVTMTITFNMDWAHIQIIATTNSFFFQMYSFECIPLSVCLLCISFLNLKSVWRKIIGLKHFHTIFVHSVSVIEWHSKYLFTRKEYERKGT